MNALRIAVPKGRLQRQILAAFRAAGLDVPAVDSTSRRLIFPGSEVEWVFVKDADVPLYVELGAAAIGVAGRDQLLESGSNVYQPMDFAFGLCRLSLIAMPGAPRLSDARMIATKYPNFARRFLERENERARVVTLTGSVELAPLVGLAPYIIDLVETGATMREHGLIEVRVLERIAPVLIVNRNAYRTDTGRLRRVIEAIEAVETGKEVEVIA